VNKYARYSYFHVEGSSVNYKLHYGGYIILISCRTGTMLEKNSLVRELVHQWSVDCSHSWHGAFTSPSQHIAFIVCD